MNYKYLLFNLFIAVSINQVFASGKPYDETPLTTESAIRSIKLVETVESGGMELLKHTDGMSANDICNLGCEFINNPSGLYIKLGTDLLTLSAEKDCPFAQYNLGVLYFNEDSCLDRDIDRGVYWLKRSALNGYVLAQFKLGCILLSSEYSYWNIKEALVFLETAASAGHPESLFLVGEQYCSGENLEQSVDKGISMLKMAAERGVQKASICLGMIYAGGNGIPVDEEKSVYWYTKAADADDPDALAILGVSYLDGSGGVEKDIDRGLNYLLRSADLGSAMSYYPLGIYYKQDRYGVRDYKKALECFHKAVELSNDASSALEIGNIHFNCEGTFKDYEKAVFWFKKAADLGEDSANTMLGCIHLNGNGVPKNISKTLEYLKKAEKAEDPNALSLLGSIYYDGVEVKKDLKLAFSYFSRSANLGNPISTLMMGIFYLNGYFVAADNSKARSFFSKALELGMVQAKIILDAMPKI